LGTAGTSILVFDGATEAAAAAAAVVADDDDDDDDDDADDDPADDDLGGGGGNGKAHGSGGFGIGFNIGAESAQISEYCFNALTTTGCRHAQMT
jgi:hypothetical protein